MARAQRQTLDRLIETPRHPPPVLIVLRRYNLAPRHYPNVSNILIQGYFLIMYGLDPASVIDM